MRGGLLRRGTVGVSMLTSLVMCCAGTLAARAGEDDPASGPIEIQKLRDAVDRLNRKVEQLERERSKDAQVTTTPSTRSGSPPANPSTAALPLSQPPPQPQAPPARLTASEHGAVSLGDLWRSLHHGMREDQVSALLGPPTSKLKANSKPLWYYEYDGVGAGSVVFSQQGEVADWQRPPLGLWGLW